MGEKKDKAKSILGFIALGCALVVACVVAAPAMAVVGVVVGTTTLISASTVVGATAVVAAVGATAAISKAALHVSDGEYQEAVESAFMAVPLAVTAYSYGNAYVGMTSTAGKMTTGSNASQAGSQSSSAPNQTSGNSSGQGSGANAPAGYTQDVNGRWHRPDGTFASNQEVGLPSSGQGGNYLHRPYLRVETRQQIEANAQRAADGRFIDANTGLPTDNPVYGHRYGHENWREIQNAQTQGLTQSQFNDRMNNPRYYQIEDAYSNSTHIYEMPK